MPDSPLRPRYKPSGQVNLARFLPCLPLLVVVSIGIAFGCYGMLVIGVYIPMATVFLCVLPAVGTVWKVVGYTHCRNRSMAGVVGAVCGLAGYLGYYHLDESLRWNVPWPAVDSVPEYVAFRMATDRWEVIHRGVVVRPQQPAPGVQPAALLANADLLSWHWAVFFLEAFMAAGATLGAAVLRASRPYSEKRGRWCVRESLLLEPEAGPALRLAMSEGSVIDWVELYPQRVSADQKHCEVSVWYTPVDRDEDPDADVFVSVNGRQTVRLSPEEAAAFVHLLPALQDIAGPALPGLAADANRSDDLTSARVWSVPAPFAGLAQNPWNRFCSKCLRWGLLLIVPVLPLIALTGGTGLMAKPNLVPIWFLVVYVVGMGLLALVFTGWWLNPERMMAWKLTVAFERHLLRRAVARRPNPLVAATDPRAVFVEMCPRRFWSGTRPRCGDYDLGFLRVDNEQRVVLIEGDYQCYWIPAESILGCSVEPLAAMKTSAALFAVVLHVRLGSGAWEFPFFPLANIEGNVHWERAMALLQRIESMCGRSFGRQPPRPVRAQIPVA